MSAADRRHVLDLASGAALAGVAAIDLYTARRLSLVAYVEPSLVGLLQAAEVSLSAVCVTGVAAVLATWPVLTRPAHRRLTMAVLSLQTVGLSLDIFALLVSTLFGHRAHPLYLLLEAGLVHLSTVLLFATWYATVDHHRQLARLDGGSVRQFIGFPQQAARYPGYETWLPGFADYLSFAFTTSTSLGPAEAVPLARPAKLLVSSQVLLSLVILLVLAARAIGLIE